MQYKCLHLDAYSQILIKNLTEYLLLKIRNPILSHNGHKICVILSIKPFLAVTVEFEKHKFIGRNLWLGEDYIMKCESEVRRHLAFIYETSHESRGASYSSNGCKSGWW